ncbi:MAG TPA: sulfatase-like hydrolase/transferase, partial [Bacilli bacterium]
MNKKSMNIIARTAFVAAAAALLSVGCSTIKAEAANERPNIVLILADDLGYGDTRLTNSTSTVNTTNIKSIADNGVLITNGYVASPVCSPSRAGLMTSEYPSRFGAESNDSSRFRPERVPAQTIATLLEGSSGKGYATKIIGKWDIGGKSSLVGSTYWPIERGFGAFYGITGGISSYYRTDGTAPSSAWYFDGTNAMNDGLFTNVNQNLNVKEYVGGTTPYVDRNPNIYLTDKFTDEAVAFIDSQPGTTTNPFFLYLPYNSPHKPFMAPDAFYQNAPGSGAERLYNAMVANLDYNIGRVLTKLDNMGMTNNTLVVFVSDNGNA